MTSKQSNRYSARIVTPDLLGIAALSITSSVIKSALAQLVTIYPYAIDEVLSALSEARRYIKTADANSLSRQRLELNDDLADKCRDLISAYNVSLSELCFAAVWLQAKISLAYDQAITSAKSLSEPPLPSPSSSLIDYMATPVRMNGATAQVSGCRIPTPALTEYAMEAAEATPVRQSAVPAVTPLAAADTDQAVISAMVQQPATLSQAVERHEDSLELTTHQDRSGDGSHVDNHVACIPEQTDSLPLQHSVPGDSDTEDDLDALMACLNI